MASMVLVIKPVGNNRVLANHSGGIRLGAHVYTKTTSARL